MKSYQPIPNYHPDDKDVRDFLHSAHPNVQELRKFLARRGVFCSMRCNNVDLYDFTSQLPLDWESCQEIIQLEHLRPEVKRWTESDHKNTGELSEVVEVIKEVIEQRTEHKKEKIRIEQVKGNVVVKIDYPEIDYGKTRMIQVVEKEAEVQFQIKVDGVHVKRTSNRVANEFELNFLGILEEKQRANNKKVESTHIDIRLLTSSKARVDFFTDFMEGIENYQFIDLTGVNVNRFEDDSEVEGEEVKEEFRKKISKAIFYGQSLLTTPEYQDFLDQGFYISAATWEVERDDQEYTETVEFKAGFREISGQTVFDYKAQAIKSKVDGYMQGRRSPFPIEQQRLVRSLGESAFRSYEKHRTPLPHA